MADRLVIDVTNIPRFKWKALCSYVDELDLECEMIQD